MKTFDERKQKVQEHIAAIHGRRKIITKVTSLAMILVVLALVLFVPYNTTPPSTIKYQSHSYYDLIQKINQVTYEPPEYVNNFEAVKDAIFSGLRGPTKDAVENIAPAPSMGAQADNTLNGSGEYVEVTDNQVQGVIESDIFKRSTEYIYYLRGSQLSVYSIAKENSTLLGSFTIPVEQVAETEGESKPVAYLTSVEMYLSQDCSTVTVVMQAYNREMGTTTTLVSLDVTDPQHIKEINRVYMSGSYLSSRMVDGKLLVMSRFHIATYDLNFDDPTTFVPQVGTKDDMRLVAPEDIESPDALTNLTYTVVSVVDEKTLAVQDTAAVLSYSDQMYVSQDTVYATRTFTHTTEKDANGRYTQATKTEIIGIRYAGEKLEFVGSITLDGTVKNQYSMDQHDGVLRVVTSTSATVYREFGNQDTLGVTIEDFGRNVDLYCVDLENWQIAASVIAFAPDGEDAQSVRFDGDKAYVCTAVVITFTDPVYFFDLSDLENITYTDTGTIDGYSTTLIQLGDGYLLGIGYGDSRQLKVEVYKELDGKVISVCTYELDAYFSEEYKCYYIDRENDLIGLPVRDYEEGTRYILLHFDGYDLNCIAIASWYGDMSDVRATIIDGYLYVLSRDFVVKQVW